MASQLVLVVKNLPENAGDAGNMGSILGLKDPLEKKIAAHSSILAWNHEIYQRVLKEKTRDA